MENEKEKTDYQRCIRCGRKLKNPEYRERGYGKICWEKTKHKETSVLFTLDK